MSIESVMLSNYPILCHPLLDWTPSPDPSPVWRPGWKSHPSNYALGLPVTSPILNCLCCCYSVAKSCLTLCNPMDWSMQGLSFAISWSLLKPMSIESVMPSKHLILCCPLLLLLSIFSSNRIFSTESSLCIRWPRIGASASAAVLQVNIQVWFPLGLTDLISLQSKGLSSLQHHNLKASILQHSAFFMFQLSHPCMTPGKTIALTTQPFVSKVRSLLFNMLSRIVIVFLPRSKRLLIS